MKFFDQNFAFFAAYSIASLALVANANGNLAEIQEEFTNLLKWETPPAVFSQQWLSERVSPATLSKISALVGNKDLFANRNKAHLKAVHILKDVFTAQETREEVLQIAHALRDHPQINPKLWLQALITAKMVHPDMKSLHIPPLVEIMPDDFIPKEIFESPTLRNGLEEECLFLNETFGEDNGVENKLWYFREDLMVNSHHWFWHIYYSSLGFIPDLRADRRGELFSYMHHEFLARYGAERLSAGLPKISRLSYDYVTPLEHYYNHLSDMNSGGNWTDRKPDTKLSDIAINFGDNQWYNVSVHPTKVVQDYLMEDASAGYLFGENGTLVPLDGFTGIDLLVDTVETSLWSLGDVARYSGNGDPVGGFHNDGHSLLGLVSNPIQYVPGPVQLQPGVMSGTSTSMRDPIFYRHHQAVEDIFLQHKNMLEPHAPNGTEFPLAWNEVEILDLFVTAESGDIGPNRLQTMWTHKEYNFTRGLDFRKNSSSDPVLICSKHLDHVEFDYTIYFIGPDEPADINATVRIYMAPRYDSNMERFSMEEQRSMFFALDLFPITMHSGINRITRNSRDSTLTIPFESWLDLEDSDVIFQNCGCGWPHHLLLPIGSAAGTTFDLFAMMTREDENMFEIPGDEVCRVAPLWCGFRDHRYPSAFPMGFPFDRRPYSVTTSTQPGSSRVVADLEEYILGIPNMIAVQVNIQHIDGSM